MQGDLGWSRSTIVGVLTIEKLVAGAFGVWLGPRLDRHGARLIMTVSAFIAGAALIGNALVNAPWQSYALWAVVGLTVPGLQTMGPVVAISNWFVRKRSQAIMFATLSSAVSGLILAPGMATVAESLSWRVSWVLMGVLMWVIIPMAWGFVRQRPEDVGLTPDGEPVPASKPDTPARPTAESAIEAYWTVSRALHSRSFWLLSGGFMLTQLPASSIFIHMSSFVQSRGYSFEEGAAGVSIYGIGVLAGRFIWGYAVAKLGMHRSLVSYAFIYGVSILLFTLPTQLWAIYLSIVLLGIAIAGALQLRAQAFPDYFGRRIVGTLLGYASIISTITTATAPLIVALAYDSTGSYIVPFTAWGICCLIAGVGFLFSKPKQPAAA
jgi:sugar phosphate permease